MLNYSIHTFELYASLNHCTAIELKKTLKNRNPSIVKNWTISANSKIARLSYTYRHLSMSGINSIRLTEIRDSIGNGVVKTHMYIIINPYHILQPDNTDRYQIIPGSDMKTALKKLEVVLRSILNQDTLCRLSLNRVDFCIDINFSTQKLADDYLKLIMKSVPIKCLRPVQYYNESQRRNTPYSDSLYLECICYSFQVYAKYNQMIKRKLSGSDGAIGTLRFEYRANRIKLIQLAHKHKITDPSKDFFSFIEKATAITNHEIPYLMYRMDGTGSFYPYQVTKNIIQQSNNSESDKHLMLSATNYLSRHHNGHDMVNSLGISQTKWNQLMEKFNYLGCSPITLPTRWKYDRLKGLYEIFNN